MFKQGITASLTGLSLILASAAVSAAPITVNDEYIGADGGSHGDVVGLESKFDIYSMDIEQNGSEFNFTVNTAFAGKAGVYSQYTVGNTGIGYGDLFLASEWTPNGTAASGYASDNAANGTDWTWGLVLSDRYADNGGTVSLVQLPGTNIQSTILSDELMLANSGAEWRYGQEVTVDTSFGGSYESGYGQPFGEVGSWSLGADQLNINVDLSQTDLLGGDSLAFHWGMTCANDVIEGEVELTKKVPEPGTIGLIALALAGMLFMRRRSNKA